MKTPVLKIFLLSAFIALPALLQEQAGMINAMGLQKKQKNETDTSQVYRYARKALDLLKNSKTDPAYVRDKIDSAEMICEKRNIEMPALLHLVRAEYFFRTGDFNNSVQEASSAIKLARLNMEYQVLADAFSFMGRYSLRTGYYRESINYFQECIDVARKNKIKRIIPWTHFIMKDVYDTLALNNRDEYNNTLRLSIAAAAEEKDTSILKWGYFTLGTFYADKIREFNPADSLLRKAYDLSVLTHDTLFQIRVLVNMGWNFYLVRNYNESVKTYQRSLSLSLPRRNYAFSANAMGNLGNIYRDLGDIENAIKYYTKSIYYSKPINDIYNMSWVYNDMSKMYLLRKDTAKAYENFVLFKKYSDTLIKAVYSKNLSDARIKYEAERHNKELELLSLKLRNQRLVMWGSIGLLILSLVVGILVLSRSRINSKRRLAEMKRQISEVTQANLRQQMNPHFIFNTLNSIQYYMYRHDKLATNNYLTKFSSLMRKVLENSQHTSIPLKDELDALNLYLELETIRFKDKFTYQIIIDEEIDTILYKVPTMLIQPYVENAICHGIIPAEDHGMIKIELKLEKDYISCCIEDNGIGREAAQERKNRTDTGHNSLGTQIVSSRLDLVNALYGSSLKTIYTDLKDLEGQPVGTRVEIQIPVMS